MSQQSYSQYGEDLIIADIFGAHVGRLLDIGAWDPIAKSNSRLLIEKGWSAVLIEPSPTPLRNLIGAYGPRFVRRESQDIVVVGAAVGLVNGMVEITMSDDAVSTSDRQVLEIWGKDNSGGYYGRCYFPVITIQDIFAQFGGPFDFVNIDTEGSSVQLAMEYLKTESFPKVLCVEHDDAIHPGQLRELMAFASARGAYASRMANKDSATTNVILVRG
jgi:FkbM family methyltransferase